MARLFSSGFELNTTSAGVEWQDPSGSPVVQSTTVRSGTYAMQITNLISGTNQRLAAWYLGVEATGEYYHRFYFRVATLPSAENRIAIWNDSAFAITSPSVYLTLDNSGVLKLYDEDGQITGTSTLSVNTWYCVEVHINTVPAAGSQIIEARVNGAAAFASSSTGSIATTNQPVAMYLGGNLASEAQTTGNWYFDDVAINNTTDPGNGTQMSWPGEGSIVHLRPNAAGDNAATTGIYTDIDEVTPDDDTTRVELDTNVTIADYNVDSSALAGIGSSDAVTLVTVGMRYREEAAVVTSMQTRIKSASGGTTTSSAASEAGSVGYTTNTAIPSQVKLTSYTDPTTGVPWTPTGTNSLDNMQIGVASLDADDFYVTTLWALVEYVPAGGGGYTGDIKAFSTVLQASQKKISGVAQAAIKKVSGVSNV